LPSSSPPISGPTSSPTSSHHKRKYDDDDDDDKDEVEQQQIEKKQKFQLPLTFLKAWFYYFFGMYHYFRSIPGDEDDADMRLLRDVRNGRGHNNDNNRIIVQGSGIVTRTCQVELMCLVDRIGDTDTVSTNQRKRLAKIRHQIRPSSSSLSEEMVMEETKVPKQVSGHGGDGGDLAYLKEEDEYLQRRLVDICSYVCDLCEEDAPANECPLNYHDIMTTTTQADFDAVDWAGTTETGKKIRDYMVSHFLPVFDDLLHEGWTRIHCYYDSPKHSFMSQTRQAFKKILKEYDDPNYDESRGRIEELLKVNECGWMQLVCACMDDLFGPDQRWHFINTHLEDSLNDETVETAPYFDDILLSSSSPLSTTTASGQGGGNSGGAGADDTHTNDDGIITAKLKNRFDEIQKEYCALYYCPDLSIIFPSSSESSSE
jgi:hypothetical protein